MKGIVGIIGQEASRYTSFWGDLSMLESPDGVEQRIVYDGTLGMARNALVAQFLATDASWLVMIDDDHAIAPEYLRRWLKRHETKLNAPVRLPIVASLYLTRGAPFATTLYGAPLQGHHPHTMDLERFSLKDFPTAGIVDQTLDGRKIYAAGASGLFVRRDVYERMPQPWYELGQSDNIGEDFWFCVKAQRLGIPVHVDLECRLGHLAPFAVWPDQENGEWVTSIRRGRVNIVIDAGEATGTTTIPADALGVSKLPNAEPWQEPSLNVSDGDVRGLIELDGMR